MPPSLTTPIRKTGLLPQARQAAARQLSFIFRKRRLGLEGPSWIEAEKINGDLNCEYELPEP